MFGKIFVATNLLGSEICTVQARHRGGAAVDGHRKVASEKLEKACCVLGSTSFGLVGGMLSFDWWAEFPLAAAVEM